MWKSLVWSHFLTENWKTCKFGLLIFEHLSFTRKSWKIEFLTLNMKNVKIAAVVAFLDGKLKSNFRLWAWKMWKSLLWSHFLTENRKTCKFGLLIVWASQFKKKYWKIEFLTLNMKNVKIAAVAAFLDGKLKNL